MVRKLIDIGANLTDLMYEGLYGSKSYHEPDLHHVLNRSWSQGLEKIIVTGGSLEDCKKAVDLVSTNDKLFTTVGCHPTRCKEFEADSNPDAYYESLLKLINENKKKVVAVGEIGLDYDRLNFCDKETQKKYFKKQLNLSAQSQLPLFLHCRNSAQDFLQVLSDFPDLQSGVVHSFDGTIPEAQQILDRGFYIGINGCSLKTESNIEVVKNIPESRLLIETDSPWCGIRPTHAGFKYVQTKFKTAKKGKKVDWEFGTYSIDGRNEPAMIVQVLEIIAAIKNKDPDSLCDQIYNNTVKLFFNKDSY